MPVAVALLATVNSAEATQFEGEIRGVWEAGTDFAHTYGVSQVGIKPGDTFSWSYVYNADDVNGTFSPWDNGLEIIKSDPLFPYISGTVLNFDVRPFALGLVVADGAVAGLVGAADRFLWEYDFFNPDTGLFEGGRFSVGLNDFRGFGAGRLTWSDPVPVAVPETSTCILLSLGLLPLWLMRGEKK